MALRNMTVVCGTDFSEHSMHAARAAGAIARRLDVPLQLVHVIPSLGVELTPEAARDAEHAPLRERLRAQAERVRAEVGVEVTPVIVRGPGDDALTELAKAARARLIVVSALGGTKHERWLLGSVAERVAQSSPIPVLVVQSSEPVEAWVRGERPLRVMVGVEPDSTSKPALLWAAALRAIGPCDLWITQVVFPYWESHRLGIDAPFPESPMRPELHAILERDLRTWAGDLPGEGTTTFTVTRGWGSVATDLAELAAHAGVDLLVVGTHRRALVARLWQESVSRGVLHRAPCNVACVPPAAPGGDQPQIATFRRVLVPTDFSPLANRAIPVGYGLVARGGVVHLLHVAAREHRPEDPDPRAELAALVPEAASARGVTTMLEIVREQSASKGIWHAAGRLGVDAICMATHGRSGVERALLGSQAQEVVQRARQPVVLVPREWES